MENLEESDAFKCSQTSCVADEASQREFEASGLSTEIASSSASPAIASEPLATTCGVSGLFGGALAGSQLMPAPALADFSGATPVASDLFVGAPSASALFAAPLPEEVRETAESQKANPLPNSTSLDQPPVHNEQLRHSFAEARGGASSVNDVPAASELFAAREFHPSRGLEVSSSCLCGENALATQDAASLTNKCPLPPKSTRLDEMVVDDHALFDDHAPPCASLAPPASHGIQESAFISEEFGAAPAYLGQEAPPIAATFNTIETDAPLCVSDAAAEESPRPAGAHGGKVEVEQLKPLEASQLFSPPSEKHLFFELSAYSGGLEQPSQEPADALGRPKTDGQHTLSGDQPSCVEPSEAADSTCALNGTKSENGSFPQLTSELSTGSLALSEPFEDFPCSSEIVAEGFVHGLEPSNSSAKIGCDPPFKTTELPADHQRSSLVTNNLQPDGTPEEANVFKQAEAAYSEQRVTFSHVLQPINQTSDSGPEPLQKSEDELKCESLSMDNSQHHIQNTRLIPAAEHTAIATIPQETTDASEPVEVGCQMSVVASAKHNAQTHSGPTDGASYLVQTESNFLAVGQASESSETPQLGDAPDSGCVFATPLDDAAEVGASDSGWAQDVTPEGYPYWYNYITGESSWNMPAEVHAPIYALNSFKIFPRKSHKSCPSANVNSLRSSLQSPESPRSSLRPPCQEKSTTALLKVIR